MEWVGTDVLWLDDPRATDPRLSGAKAAALAKAAAAGLPIVPGFVLSSEPRFNPQRDQALEEGEIHSAWSKVSAGQTTAVIVRSSSSIEDGRTSSKAGVFESILGVTDWDGFGEAVEVVRKSGNQVISDSRMAVLVQSELDPSHSGVAFGADPTSGRTDLRVISAVAGSPAPLVSGRVMGTRYTLTDSGRVLQIEGDSPNLLTRRQRRRLLRLCDDAAELFGSPQDIEWAFDRSGGLWLLQSRPITAMARHVRASGPLFGPGPIAETFPEPLAPLEQDLWLDPLRTAIREALLLAGATGRRRLERSPIVVVVGGRAAVDLDLLGLTGSRSLIARLDPRPAIRRLGASWRVGRLRAALPNLTKDLVGRIDAELGSVPDLHALDSQTILGILHSARRRLVALHGHEVLAGLMMTGPVVARSASSIALHALSTNRRHNMSDLDIIGRDPAVLSLIPPQIPPTSALPPTPRSVAELPHTVDPLAQAREDLRMRARWVQELTARAATALGQRLAGADLLPAAETIREVRLHELPEVVDGTVVPLGLEGRAPAEGAPLPAAFRLTADGQVVAETTGGTEKAQGASGGRTTGTVRRPGDPLGPGDVLVVRHLDPKLAPLLPELGGLVAETGSVLSHLAILAREYGVPTVVGVRDALDRFRPGTTILVDGSAGQVIRLGEEEPA